MASYKLKRKTYAFLGWGNMAKTWKAAGAAFKNGQVGKGLLNGAKSIGTGAVYTGVGALGATALATPMVFNKMTGEG